MRYSCDKNFIYLANPPFKRKDEIKEILNPSWFDNKKLGKGWRFPKNVHVYRELWKFFPELRNDGTFTADGALAASDLKYAMHHKENFMLDDDRLREYQKRDAAFLESRGNLQGGCLVLNEPRTGKTPTVISVMKALNKTRNIVICPSSLVFNWAKEFSIWYPEIKVYPINNKFGSRVVQYVDYMNDTHNGKNCVLIVSKDTWKTDLPKVDVFDDVRPFDVAVVDEAHFLRNYKSAQSKAIFNLKANVKYALTGTPSVKHGSDAFGLLHFVNPEAFPSYWQFTDRYWNINDNGWGKNVAEEKEHRIEELKSLMAVNSVQRKRMEVMGWLPAATHQTIPVVMESAQVKLYEQMFEEFMAVEGEGDDTHEVDTMNKLTQLMRLRQLCLDPRLLGFKPVGTKTKALLEFADDNVDPFVVMTTFSSYFKLIRPELEKMGKNVGVIDGSTTKPMRQKYVEWFQSGKIDILLCNIQAAGVGLTLDRADTVIFLDKAFNPADNEQAQDRIVPTTKERYHPINVISLVCAGTVDERVNQILDRKEDLTKLINKPEVFM